MNGTIDLVSNPGAGSTATFTLPLKVSAWSGNIPIARTASESQILTQSLRRSSTHRDILNQEISDLVSSSSRSQHGERRSDSEADEDKGTSADTTEKRKHTHVLVVEDK
jgi:hypothetical protein